MANNLSSTKSKIILTNSLTTARRFIQKQNIKNGIDVTDYATHTMHSLVQELLFLCGNTSRVVSNHESAYILLKRIENNTKDGFGLKATVKSLGAALKLLEVLDDYRLNGLDDFAALEKAQYKELLKAYKDYLDSKDLIDYVEALNKLASSKLKRPEEVYLMSDVSLRPLEEKVLEQIFEGGIITLPDEAHEIKVIKNFEVYGQYGELLNALDYIEENKIPLGDVEIIYTDSIFENLIKGTCDARKIKYTLKCNHGKTTNLISFIYDVLDYFSQDFKYELLEKVLSNLALSSVYLKEFYETISFPKYIVGSSYKRSIEFLDAYKGVKKIKHFYELFEAILSVVDVDKQELDYPKLLLVAKKYLFCEKEKAVLWDKLKELNNIIQHETKLDRKIDLIKKELDEVTYSEKDNPDYLSFSQVNKSFTTRPYIIVLGLNQNLLVGSDVENAFIDDLKKYSETFANDKNAHISANYRKRQIYCLKYYLSHSDAEVILSHSSDNKIDLRDMTDGTYLLELDDLPKKEVVNAYEVHSKTLVFNQTNGVLEQEEVEQDYDNGEFKEVEGKEKKDVTETEVKEIVAEEEIKDFTLSSSTLKDLIECPLKFYYQKILNIISVQFPELDEAVWLEANSKGTYFHEIMQNYFNNFINKKPEFDGDIFEAAFDKATEEAEKKNPVNNDYIHDKEIADIKLAAYNYLHLIIDRDFTLFKVLSNEAKLTNYKFTYPKCDKLFFSGDIDRVDGRMVDKTLRIRIIDYKTGRFKEKADHGYYQHVLYPYILEQALNNPDSPKLAGLDYDDVQVDEFIYSFPFDELGREDKYQRSEFDKDSEDYKKVMQAIDTFVVSYLKEEKNYLQNAIKYFDDTHEIADSEYGSTCGFCKYKKECIKRVMEGYEIWKAK